MEITDQDISDFIKSRGKFTYTKAEPSSHFGRFYFEKNQGDVWQYSLEIFGIEVSYQVQSIFFKEKDLLDDMKDHLIKSIISKYKQRILTIIKREENIKILLDGNN